MIVRTSLLLALMLLLGVRPLAAQDPNTSCLRCHGDANAIDEDSAALVHAFEADIHREVGLSCHDCHGGNPDPALYEDLDAAMDEDYAPNPYRSAPSRAQVPEFCGRCHSDPDYMRRFAPALRVDQVAEYWTSRHGTALRQGDEKVATCIDCHGVHGIVRSHDPSSPVYPKNVATTCGACHADPERMSGYKLTNGSTLPVNQYALWEQSVHAAALLQKGDLSAPTCNDCHGNHGAVPPGVESVGFVCGQCHGREAELFRASKKHAGFENHRQYMLDANGNGCAECHDLEGSDAGMHAPYGFVECSSCHGNHGIVRPTVAMLAPLPESPCAFCHEPIGAAQAVQETEAVVAHYRELKDTLEAAAAAQGLTDLALFDWLTDQALQLPTHTQTSKEGESSLRPEFARLFEKFRIGKTHYEYVDPQSKAIQQAAIVRCNSCHVGEDPSNSKTTAQGFVDKTRELTSMTAQAERMLLKARRGGVETRDALAALDEAVNAQIGLEVLVHGFELGGKFEEQHQVGLEHAESAFSAADGALVELGHRRRGLYVALALAALVAVGLALKIRRVDASA